MIVLADAPLVPFWSAPTFTAALVAVLLAAAAWIGRQEMQKHKARRKEAEDASAPELTRSARQELETVKSDVVALKGEVAGLKADVAQVKGDARSAVEGVEALNEKADDLATGIETARDRIQDIDDKVGEAAIEVAGLSRDMEWVKRYLESIGRKLGI